jgi:hypothetical protein
LTHELVHLVHNDRAGHAVIDAPTWLAEGMARWVALPDEVEQDEELLSYVLRGPGTPGVPPEEIVDPATMLADRNELERAGYRAQATAGELIFFALAESRGERFVRDLVVELLSASDGPAALERACEWSLDEISHLALLYYARWYARMSRGIDLLVEASRSFEDGNIMTTNSALHGLSSAEVPPVLNLLASRLRWSVTLASGDAERALGEVRSFRENHPSHELVWASWRDEMEILTHLGRWGEARVAADRLLIDFVRSDANTEFRMEIERIRHEIDARDSIQ